MRFPTLWDAILTILGLGRYSTARAHADAEVAALAHLIATPQSGLVASIGARNAADDALTDCEAVRDFRVDKLGVVIMDLGRQAYAHFGSRKDPGYLRLYPKAPSDLASLSEHDRSAFLPGWLKDWQAKETPAAFAPTVKKLADAWKAVRAAEVDVLDGQKALAKARAAEAAARTAWMAGYRRLHAQLTDRFPTDKAHVERFFRSPAATKAKKPAPAPQPMAQA